jgi:hypothetical protein
LDRFGSQSAAENDQELDHDEPSSFDQLLEHVNMHSHRLSRSNAASSAIAANQITR